MISRTSELKLHLRLTYNFDPEKPSPDKWIHAETGSNLCHIVGEVASTIMTAPLATGSSLSPPPGRPLND